MRIELVIDKALIAAIPAELFEPSFLQQVCPVSRKLVVTFVYVNLLLLVFWQS